MNPKSGMDFNIAKSYFSDITFGWVTLATKLNASYIDATASQKLMECHSLTLLVIK